MNDEQFEATMECLRDELADKLRARDTAQREALARVEAERDRWIANYNHLIEQHMPRTGHGCEEGWSRVVEARELQAQLAEAVGLLRAIDRDIWPEWESRFGKSAALINVQAFLADYAQAEQQEAHVCRDCNGTGKPLDPVEHADDHGYCESCGATGRAGEEAQGAQAVDERAAFEKWRNTQADSLRRCGYPDGAQAFINLGSVQWAGWQARAALATQPAAGEPVYQYMGLCGEWVEAKKSFYEYQKKHGYKVRILWTAPPAAAHEDEAVRARLCEAYESGYQDGQKWPDSYSIQADKDKVADALIAAMRGQAGEGGEA